MGALYANTSVTWSFSKSLGLAALLVIVPIFAGIGNMLFQWVSVRWRVRAQTIIIVNNICMALVPAYGLLGYANRALGYRRWCVRGEGGQRRPPLVARGGWSRPAGGGGFDSPCQSITHTPPPPPPPPHVRRWELYLAVIWYGLHLGSVQSFSRAMFGRMIPEGHEAQFYALFSFTDRGSSWIGPAVVAAVIQATGTIRMAFVYPLVALTVPSLALLLVRPAAAEADAKAYALRHGTARSKGVEGDGEAAAGAPSTPAPLLG